MISCQEATKVASFNIYEKEWRIMKIMHLSDLHIGIRLHNYDMGEDQQYIFEQMIECARAEQPDAVVIAGDIYDRSVPSAEAVEMFDHFITRLSEVNREICIMAISGNHDSAVRLDCFRNILKRERIYIAGSPPKDENEFMERVTLSDEFGRVNFYLLPFVKPAFVREIVGEQAVSHDEAVHLLIGRENVDERERNVIVSHQFYVKDRAHADEVERAETEVYTVGNIDSVTCDCLAAFDYAALGHLHKPMRVERDAIRYCGTPMPYSLSEEGQEKGIVFVEIGEKGTAPRTRTIPLKPLRSVRRERGTLEEVLAVPSDDYVWVSLTEKADLDASDMQIKLREAFPHLLGVQNEHAAVLPPEDIRCVKLHEASAYDLFLQFCPDLDEEDKNILRDVIHTVRGVI